jgi:NADPH-dependent 2,4-dienoyl-CoA reductase/sulfur reductase-like enzyme
MDNEEKYSARAKRMISRWAGKRLTYERRQTSEGAVMQHEAPQRGELNESEDVYIEQPKALPILDRCDVLVVGAGPAGSSFDLHIYFSNSNLPTVT